MGFFDSIGSILGSAGSLFGSGAGNSFNFPTGAISSAMGSGMQSGAQLGLGGGGGFGSMLGSLGSMSGKAFGNIGSQLGNIGSYGARSMPGAGSGFGAYGMPKSGGFGGTMGMRPNMPNATGGGNRGGGILASLFGQEKGKDFNLGGFLKSPGTMMGVGGAGMLGSQLIGNPKHPGMPEDYNEYMRMMMGGGTPGMAQAGAHWGNVLSGQNKDMYEAATHDVDLQYQEQLRNLNAQYKSLRPGTDITTDSAYRRDMQQLQDQYSRRRAQVLAGVQQTAASGLAGLGGQQMQGMAQGLGAQFDMIADQMGMDFSQKQALRNSIMGIGEAGIGGAMGTGTGTLDKLIAAMLAKEGK